MRKMIPKDPACYLAIVQAYNTFVAEFCAAAPDRLIGVAMLPESGIGDALGEACKAASAEGVIVQNLAYLMRSGPPDATDRQVAYGFGALAVELLASGRHGRLCVVSGGRFADVPIDTLLKGQKRVDVARHYDAETYRPKLTASDGLSLFGF